jgi:hypothetical protein
MSIAARVGGDAEEELTLTRYDGRLFVFESARAFAPGQPMAVQLEAEHVGGGRISLDLKAIGSVRRPSGGYEVRARAATLTRGARTRLEQAFGITS